MPECYMPYGQHAFNGATLSLVGRTTWDPNALAQTLRRLAHENNPDVPMKFTTMEAMLSENVAAPRFRAVLFAVFAGLAVCLAMAGIYGVMAFTVGRRSNEIGLRIALGASTGSVAQLVRAPPPKARHCVTALSLFSGGILQALMRTTQRLESFAVA